MITYLYKDTEGNFFEEKQSMKDEALSVSPHTGLPCKRVITGGKVFLDGTMPGEKIRTENRRNKARTINPMHTTLDYYDQIIKERTKPL
jgi:predicted nucleic acid-binding Zn ribbon protein